MSTDKVIVTCALTGVLANRDQCPWVPYTPAEIAEEARRAYEAGAAVVHVHARTDEGGATYEPSVYAAIRREIEQRCPVILNFSTGGAGPMEGRVAHIAQVRPEIGALNMGSMNYAKYSPKRKDFVFDFVFENPFRDISYLLSVMKGAGVKPELECFVRLALPCCKHDVLRCGDADQRHDAVRRTQAVSDSEFRRRNGKEAVGRCDPTIASHGHFHAGTDTEASYHGDDGYLAAAQGPFGCFDCLHVDEGLFGSIDAQF